jgi:predicted transcriptional regulator
MARKKSPTLTEAELRIMDVLWDLGRATVSDVVDALMRSRALAYNTVLTTLRILDTKGYVEHFKEGRAFVYSARVDRVTAQRSALRHILSRFFDGSREDLVLNLLDDEKLNARELKRLKAMIAESE